MARMIKASPSDIIVGTRDGMVYCIDAETGDIIWEYDAGAQWGGGTIDGQNFISALPPERSIVWTRIPAG